MPDIIRLLPDSVANQIAAGEVIQRPASVIKELVENAIDAGATSIEIVLKDAGKTLIQVIDNGKGMTETDARLAFERHATSKIEKADDLFALRTMGFRGEALASIAAIAQVELRTRMSEAPMGTKLCISGSRCESQEPDFCPAGSNFMIKNLFYNVPARRKFLKQASVEMSNIIREFERLALVNHSTAFKLTHNGNLMYQLMSGDSFKQRIVSLFSKSLGDQLITIDTDTALVKISGYVTRPESARKRNYLQYMFVNGRHMRHPYFHKAVMQCYEQLIPSNEQPNYFLNFEVAPETIDVNIHPTKSEIKFENEQPIWQILFAAVRESLGKFSAVPSIEFDTEGAIDIPLSDGGEIPAMPQVDFDPTYNPFASSQSHSQRQSSSYHYDRESNPALRNWDELYKNFESNRRPTEEHIVASRMNIEDSEAEAEAAGSGYMQLKDKYILVPGKSGLMLIDQRRAHIRVLYEQMLEAKANNRVESQRVMFQEVLTLTAAQNVILEEIKDEMERLGFELGYLGNCSWSVNSIPTTVKKINVKDFIYDVVDSAVSGGVDLSQRMAEHIALSSARTAAIMSGQRLTQTEIDSLVSKLFRTKEVQYTPDGKKIICTLTYDEINKLFS